jgi:hypothetical protein
VTSQRSNPGAIASGEVPADTAVMGFALTWPLAAVGIVAILIGIGRYGRRWTDAWLALGCLAVVASVAIPHLTADPYFDGTRSLCTSHIAASDAPAAYGYTPATAATVFAQQWQYQALPLSGWHVVRRHGATAEVVSDSAAVRVARSQHAVWRVVALNSCH